MSKDIAYKVYVTDALKIIAENTANGCVGSFPTERYIDKIKRTSVDNRTGEEVVADVISKAGLEVVE